jgi:phage baseplate assembly protein V
MSRKNLLSDSDFTRGHDTRFANAVVIGLVSKIECDDKHANVRVLMPDKKDHNGDSLISKPVPVLQSASTAKRSYAIPRLGTPVVMIKMANSTSDYLVVGSFYSTSNPPPVSDPKLDYVIYDDGSTMQFDANDGKGELTWKLKGDVLFDNEKKLTINHKGDVAINTTNGAKMTLHSDSDLNIEAPNGTLFLDQQNIHLKGSSITLEGPVTILGDITHTGNMTTSGVHTDVNGHHTTSLERESELLNRIKALETRLQTLESVLPREIKS